MITFIHGDDTAASRQYYITERQKIADPILFEGDKVTLTDITQTLQGGGLFSVEKYIFIEQFFTKRKKSDEQQAIIETIRQSTDTSIFFWDGKELDKKTLTQFPKAQAKLFKLPQTLFIFLDSLKPGNGKELVKLFHETAEQTDTDMIFFMLIKQLRLLLALSSPIDDPIDEIKRLAPWQKGKLEKQVKLFTTDELKDSYHKLFTIDLAQKTGQLPYSLSRAIDFWLLEL